jgi:hypothetical protein
MDIQAIYYVISSIVGAATVGVMFFNRLVTDITSRAIMTSRIDTIEKAIRELEDNHVKLETRITENFNRIEAKIDALLLKN